MLCIGINEYFQRSLINEVTTVYLLTRRNTSRTILNPWLCNFIYGKCNGIFMIITHDSVSLYCSVDGTLFETLDHFRSKFVFIDLISVYAFKSYMCNRYA